MKQEQKNIPERAAYAPDELANRLGVSRTTVYKGLRSGDIPAIRLGRRFVIAKAAVEEWLRTAGRF